MSYTLEQIKEMMDEMTRKVAEFVKTNTEVASENMEEMANNLKEGWREMTVKVAEVLETNTEMVNKNMVEMANNLEEAWGDMVEEHFGGDDSIALQVFISPILLDDGH